MPRLGEKSEHRQRDEDDAGQPLLAAKTPGHERRRDRAEDDGRERAEFQHAVAPRKFPFGQQLRQQAVFGRAEKRAVNAHQKNTAEQRPASPQRGRHAVVQQLLLPREAREREQHHQHFKSFDADGNRPLAETVGQKTARHGKHDERQREQRADEFADFVLLGERHVQADEHEDDEIFQDVVAERALKLRDDERPETARGGMRSAECGMVPGFVHGATLPACAPERELKNFCRHRLRRCPALTARGRRCGWPSSSSPPSRPGR